MRPVITPSPCAAILALLLAGCGREPTGPADLVGQYVATTFQFVQGSDTTDVLAAGGWLTITLTADGATAGQLSVPAALHEGTPFTASMDGTFTVNHEVVTFDQAADSFVRDMPFTVTLKMLSGSHSAGGTTVIVVLTRP